MTTTAITPAAARGWMKRAVAGLVAAALTAVSTVPALADFSMFAKHTPDATTVVDHSAWDKLLKSHIKPDGAGINRLDYAGFKANGHKQLKAYVASLEGVDPTTLNRTEQFAYWANLYNAKTIDVVLDAYPVDSIRKISINEGVLGFFKKAAGLAGPWKAKVVTVNGTKLSLDNVEHDIMRKVFQDPRVHYAVNCASVGCPNLRLNAFTSANLETELEAGARAYVNHPRGFRVNDDGTVVASSIYSWFQVDFGGTPAAVLEHARKYASAELKAKLDGKTQIASFEYDWALNDVSPTN
ncbi:MAG: DUF547 domain-containing protein [Pseudomonadota bacterium]